MRKKTKRYLSGFFNSLSFKLFAIIILLLGVLISLYITIGSRLQMKILEDTVGQAAYRQSDLIKRSLYPLMLVNERDELYQTIMLMGDEPGVERIRVYNKTGEIKFSTKASENGQIVDMRAEACYACHSANEVIQSLPMQKKTRIYKTADGRRIMGMINPINNAPECSSSSCHAHSPDQTILGVLDVQMSLNELDQAMFKVKSLFYIIFIGVIFLAMILLAVIVYFTIFRPIRILEMGTTTLAAGDLDHRIKMQRKDELGMLAKSFNHMASNLKRAYTELKNWSNLLEKRVEEKTDELERIHHGMLQVENMASLGKIAASVAHELNNPLAGIVINTKLVQKQLNYMFLTAAGKEKIVQELDLIYSESMRCGSIVRNLLEFARGTSSNFQESDVDKIIERAVRLVHHHFELAKIELKRDIENNLHRITCDPEQMLQALVALLVNAVEAMPDGGQVNISAKNSTMDSDWVIIKVQDTGIGIPDDVKEKILEPFFSTKKHKRSVGLGLAVVYGIIQRHQGTIKVESVEGEGATIILELPVHHISGK